MPQLAEKTLSTGQAARQLGVSSEWVRRLVEAGQLPALETPLGYLIDARSVDELAEARRRQRVQEKASS